MPFICWASLAEPGHPHQRPHFVFADPVLAAPTQNEDHSRHRIWDANCDATKPHTLACHPAGNTDPLRGQASPTLLLFSLLLLVAVAAGDLRRIDQPSVKRICYPPFPESLVLRIPVPPPRLAPAC